MGMKLQEEKWLLSLGAGVLFPASQLVMNISSFQLLPWLSFGWGKVLSVLGILQGLRWGTLYLSTWPLRLCASLERPFPPPCALLAVPKSFRFHRPLLFVSVYTTPLTETAGFDTDTQHSVKTVLPNVNCLAGGMYWLKPLLVLINRPHALDSDVWSKKG